MWSAAVDPRVLRARASCNGERDVSQVAARAADVRIVHGPDREHVLIDHGGEPIRLDIIDGTLSSLAVMLHFELADDARIEDQIAAVRYYRGLTPRRHHPRLANRVQALHAVDARDAGASLRDISQMLLGPGDWPGDGEHRKSLVRRLIVAGDRMIRCGPRVILQAG
ncbi:DNA -binding domain-containing protein [Novosphingobium sp.]|uniref:DNA -binding domain-containing protein n=1 Tax=Novosphingobium sp. TaxID=1874826 RepID=UPI00352A1C03